MQIFGNHWVRIADTCLLYVILALGMNIVVGYAGLLDLGYVAFYAIGAYMFALLISLAMIIIMLLRPHGLWPAPQHGKSLRQVG